MPSQKVDVLVGLPPLFKFGKVPTIYLNILVALIVLIIGIIVVTIYAWHRISLWRKRMRRETQELSRSVVDSFNVLRKELEQEIAALSKRQGLTEKEKELKDTLEKALDVSENTITKEISDIEKELE